LASPAKLQCLFLLCVPMALAAVLESLCPSPDSCQSQWCNDSQNTDHLILAPAASIQSEYIHCHRVLLQARCTNMPVGEPGDVVDVPEEAAVIFVLLRWIYYTAYSEEVDTDETPTVSSSSDSLGARAVRLARRWGLRDASCLQARVSAGRRVLRGSGSLTEDILRAYDAGSFAGSFFIQPKQGTSEAVSESKEDGRETEGTQLDGGWCTLLCGHSSYFNSMLHGGWSESRNTNQVDVPTIVKVQWPGGQMLRVLRFVHGGEFISGPEDLKAAICSANFFGIPALIASVKNWISFNLEVANASRLWNLVYEEPSLYLCSDGAYDDCSDADDACFYFHVQHFTELAHLESSEGQVVLHELRIPYAAAACQRVGRHANSRIKITDKVLCQSPHQRSAQFPGACCQPSTSVCAVQS